MNQLTNPRPSRSITVAAPKKATLSPAHEMALADKYEESYTYSGGIFPRQNGTPEQFEIMRAALERSLGNV